MYEGQVVGIPSDPSPLQVAVKVSEKCDNCLNGSAWVAFLKEINTAEFMLTGAWENAFMMKAFGGELKKTDLLFSNIPFCLSGTSLEGTEQKFC